MTCPQVAHFNICMCACVVGSPMTDGRWTNRTDRTGWMCAFEGGPLLGTCFSMGRMSVCVCAWGSVGSVWRRACWMNVGDSGSKVVVCVVQFLAFLSFFVPFSAKSYFLYKSLLLFTSLLFLLHFPTRFLSYFLKPWHEKIYVLDTWCWWHGKDLPKIPSS